MWELPFRGMIISQPLLICMICTNLYQAVSAVTSLGRVWWRANKDRLITASSRILSRLDTSERGWTNSLGQTWNQRLMYFTIFYNSLFLALLTVGKRLKYNKHKHSSQCFIHCCLQKSFYKSRMKSHIVSIFMEASAIITCQGIAWHKGDRACWHRLGTSYSWLGISYCMKFPE